MSRPDGTGMRRLTDGGKERNELGDWTDDGRFLTMSSNRRDPASMDAYLVDPSSGTMRLVAYIQADLDSSEAVDPLLPEVAWSWLVDALESRAEHVTALGGTVTATTSVRYGDISGPPRAHQLELRASWTATNLELGPHVEAFCEVLEHAAGLPPAGVTDLSSRTRA